MSKSVNISRYIPSPSLSADTFEAEAGGTNSMYNAWGKVVMGSERARGLLAYATMDVSEDNKYTLKECFVNIQPGCATV